MGSTLTRSRKETKKKAAAPLSLVKQLTGGHHAGFANAKRY